MTLVLMLILEPLDHAKLALVTPRLLATDPPPLARVVATQVSMLWLVFVGAAQMILSAQGVQPH